MLNEHKALEECFVRLDTMNDETRCFGIMNQCQLTLMRNENKVDRERETREHNELIDYYQKMGKNAALGKEA